MKISGTHEGDLRILCVGGGPAGLYFALLHKKVHPRHHVTVVEQNRADATYGWGCLLGQGADRLAEQSSTPAPPAIRVAAKEPTVL